MGTTIQQCDDDRILFALDIYKMGLPSSALGSLVRRPTCLKVH